MPLLGCFSSYNLNIYLEGGVLSEKPILDENRYLQIEEPTREDGARFLGWYQDLYFDKTERTHTYGHFYSHLATYCFYHPIRNRL